MAANADPPVGQVGWEDDPDENEGLLAGGGPEGRSDTQIEDPAPPKKAYTTVEDLSKIDLWSTEHIGFLAQYFAVGLIYGGLPATIYPFFLGYLNVPSYVYATAGVITTLPWSFKFLFGFINDCYPIVGYHRKPYMVFGWGLCASTLVLLSIWGLPEPYWCLSEEDGQYVREDPLTGKPAPPCNEGASKRGGEYAMLMMVAALGYVIADVAADGLTVQIAKQEPIERRGKTQATVYSVRTYGQVFAVLLVGLGMNGPEYNGTFSGGLSFNQVMFILALPAAAMVPISWYGVTEPVCLEKPNAGKYMRVEYNGTFSGGLSFNQVMFILALPAAAMVPISWYGVTEPVCLEKPNAGKYMRDIWKLLKSKAFFYVVAYQFLTPLVEHISTTAGGNVKQYWAGVQNLQNQMFTLFGLFLFIIGLEGVKTHLLDYSWRKMLIGTTIFLNLIDMVFVYLTVYNVVRNQYFYLGETVLVEIPAAANFVVSTFVVVEMADDGNEGLVYGLLTTIHNLGTPFARAIANQIYNQFTPSLSDSKNYIEDTQEFRTTVSESFTLSYFFAFAATLFVVLLPDQKQETQDRKANWPAKPKYAWTTVLVVGFAFCYSLLINFLSMFPSTMCLKLAGGDGCDGEEGAVPADPELDAFL